MANYVLGLNGKFYYSTSALTTTSSATALGSATEFTNVADVNSNLSKDTVELNSRANGGWKTKVGTLKDATITLKVLWKPGDAGFGAFKDAYLNNSEIACWALDGARGTEDSQGPAGNFNVVNFSRAEPIGDAMTVDVELSPSSYTHWYVDAGS